MTLFDLIKEMQKDRESRNVRPTYVPARTLFTAAIDKFGKSYPSAYETIALVRDGKVTEHETIGGTAFSITGTEVLYNADYLEPL